MRARDEMLAVAEQGVKRALAKGADAAEFYVLQKRSTKVAAAGRHVFPSESLEDAIGVRLVVDGRLGISGASTLAGIDEAIARALDSVRTLDVRGDFARFPTRSEAGSEATPLDPRLLDDRSEGLAAFADSLMGSILERPSVTYAELSVVNNLKQFAIANSEGLAVWDRTGFEKAEYELRGTRGTTERSGADALFAATPLEVAGEPAALGLAIAERVESALDPKPYSGAAIQEALFLSGPASQLLGIVSNGFSATAASADRSAFSGRLGELVASPLVTLRDEPRGPAGARHRHHDDEGVPTRNLTLVESGRLERFLHDSQSARRANAAPTGHGIRTSVSGGVAARPINLVMDAGDRSVQELIESVQRAVLVTEPLLGSFTSNQVTGDFSVTAPFAFLVENGRIQHALPPTTIGGNAHRVLQEVRALSRERRSYQPATTPAMLAGGVSCAT